MTVELPSGRAEVIFSVAAFMPSAGLYSKTGCDEGGREVDDGSLRPSASLGLLGARHARIRVQTPSHRRGTTRSSSAGSNSRVTLSELAAENTRRRVEGRETRARCRPLVLAALAAHQEALLRAMQPRASGEPIERGRAAEPLATLNDQAAGCLLAARTADARLIAALAT